MPTLRGKSGSAGDLLVGLHMLQVRSRACSASNHPSLNMCMSSVLTQNALDPPATYTSPLAQRDPLCCHAMSSPPRRQKLFDRTPGTLTGNPPAGRSGAHVCHPCAFLMGAAHHHVLHLTILSLSPRRVATTWPPSVRRESCERTLPRSQGLNSACVETSQLQSMIYSGRRPGRRDPTPCTRAEIIQ